MKFLIVEDDAFFRNYFASKLIEAGYQVVTAGDGDEGLEKVKIEKPDLILLDIIMPKKDGFEFLKILNAEGLITAQPIIVFSTLGQEEDVKKALALGAKDYINKSSFEFDKILEKIRNQLKKVP